MQTYSHRWNAKGIKEYKDDDEDKLPSRTNSLGIHVIGGNQRMPKKHRKEYVSTDAYFGPHGHYYLGGRRRRIGAGFGRRRRTDISRRRGACDTLPKPRKKGLFKGVFQVPEKCTKQAAEKAKKERAKKEKATKGKMEQAAKEIVWKAKKEKAKKAKKENFTKKEKALKTLAKQCKTKNGNRRKAAEVVAKARAK